MKGMPALLGRLGSVAILAAALCLTAFGGAGASTVEITLASVQTIADAEGNSRALVDPGDLSRFRDELILSAFLEIPLSGNEVAADLDVSVHAVTADWSGRTPTWSEPWTTPGGDFDDLGSEDSVVLRTGRTATLLELDVTDYVRGMAQGTLASHGFMLLPEGSKVGFTAGDRAVLGALGGKLVVSYRELSKHGMRITDSR